MASAVSPIWRSPLPGPQGSYRRYNSLNALESLFAVREITGAMHSPQPATLSTSTGIELRLYCYIRERNYPLRVPLSYVTIQSQPATLSTSTGIELRLYCYIRERNSQRMQGGIMRS